ncbi:hypothetical protein GCM10009799_14500 [Nocardiopsis rhodophaea]|uniref:Methylamine utilisation protein MauE domain-containing protein n=1 Tax=Nocardiopsis rhodophaea TaxID=280238 RepID=A0ABN2SNL7_9ACTN
MPYVAIGACCLIGVVFFVSSLSKVRGPRRFGDFVLSVRRVPVVPPRLAPVVAQSVLAVEFTVWILLVVPTPLTAAIGCALAAVLLVVFVVGIASVLRQGTAVPCRCFGTTTVPLGLPHLIRNIILSTIATAGAVSVLATPIPGEWAQHPGAFAAAIVGVLLGGLVVVLDDVLDLFLPPVPRP